MNVTETVSVSVSVLLLKVNDERGWANEKRNSEEIRRTVKRQISFWSKVFPKLNGQILCP
jgi:hypothetical protein